MTKLVFELVTLQNAKMLENLEKWLEQAEQYAEAKKFPVETLLQARLFPDQFHLSKQIQVACDVAKLCVARLTGKDAPKHEDGEASLKELKSRIRSVISYLREFKESDFQGCLERRVSQNWFPEGKTVSGEVFLNSIALPNFYFHVTTAYAILRHNGLPLTKGMYLGEIKF